MSPAAPAGFASPTAPASQGSVIAEFTRTDGRTACTSHTHDQLFDDDGGVSSPRMIVAPMAAALAGNMGKIHRRSASDSRFGVAESAQWPGPLPVSALNGRW